MCSVWDMHESPVWIPFRIPVWGFPLHIMLVPMSQINNSIVTRVASNLARSDTLALLALCLAFPAVTPQHRYDALRPRARRRARRSRAPLAWLAREVS